MRSPHSAHRIKTPPVYRIIAVQFVVTVTISLLAFWGGVTAAYSAALGGLICTLPNAYFVYKSFQYSGAQAMRQVVTAFYLGEMVKLLLTAVLFALVFVFVRPLNVLMLFAAFIAAQSVSWFAPTILTTRSDRI